MVTVSVVVVPTTDTTESAIGVGPTSATVRGSVVPGTGSTSAQFAYGTHRTLANATATRLQSVPSSVGAVPFSARLSGLAPHTTYYYRIRALNSTTGATISGAVRSFTTTRPVGRVVATMQWNFDSHAHYATVNELIVNDAPVGGRIALSCHGRGCPRDRTLSIKAPKPHCKVKHGKRSCAKPATEVTEHLTGLFAHVRLAYGAKLTVRITKPNDFGKMFVLTMRPPGAASNIYCPAPGSTKPRPC